MAVAVQGRERPCLGHALGERVLPVRPGGDGVRQDESRRRQRVRWEQLRDAVVRLSRDPVVDSLRGRSRSRPLGGPRRSMRPRCRETPTRRGIPTVLTGRSRESSKGIVALLEASPTGVDVLVALVDSLLERRVGIVGGSSNRYRGASRICWRVSSRAPAHVVPSASDTDSREATQLASGSASTGWRYRSTVNSFVPKTNCWRASVPSPASLAGRRAEASHRRRPGQTAAECARNERTRQGEEVVAMHADSAA